MRSVTLKSAITPSFMGRMATMLPGLRPSISLASLPTASISPVFLLMATIEGSSTTMPLPRAKTKVLAVPKSMARSLENTLNRERRFMLGDMTPSCRVHAGLRRSRRVGSAGLLSTPRTAATQRRNGRKHSAGTRNCSPLPGQQFQGTTPGGLPQAADRIFFCIFKVLDAPAKGPGSPPPRPLRRRTLLRPAAPGAESLGGLYETGGNAHGCRSFAKLGRAEQPGRGFSRTNRVMMIFDFFLSKRRHHRPRGSRQDHPGGCHAPPKRHFPRQ